MRRLAHAKRGSVFAYRTELEAWWECRRTTIPLDDMTAVPAASAALPGRLRLLAGRGVFWMLVPALGSILGLGAYVLDKQMHPLEGQSGLPSWYHGSAEAYRAYLRGRRYGPSYNHSVVNAAVRAYEEAIRLNPQFSQAWAELSMAQVGQTWLDDDMSAWQSIGRARKTAARLHELDPYAATYWRTEAWGLEWLDFDYAAAEKYHLKAIELAPANPTIVRTYAEFLIDQRRFDEATSWAKRAVDMAPVSPTEVVAYGNALYFQGKSDEAMKLVQDAVQAEPNDGLTRELMARLYLDRGDYARALEQFRKADELIGGVPFTLGDLGRAMAIAGHRAEAESILNEMIRKREAGYYPAFGLAMVHVGLGHRKDALEWLDRAIDERNTGYYSFYCDPIYDSLRSEPRYQQLIRKMKHAS